MPVLLVRVVLVADLLSLVEKGQLLAVVAEAGEPLGLMLLDQHLEFEVSTVFDLVFQRSID